jgi:hypothetical protein
MSGEQPIEQRIATFLEQHSVTIVPETRGDRDVLGYIQHQVGGGMVYLGETVYDAKTGMTDADAVPAEVAIKRLQLEGFVTEVTRPIAKLLRQTEGQFYENERWDPIHDALDRIESRYG